MRLVLALISGLGFASLGHAVTEAHEDMVADGQRPDFSIEGETFFISTECSPHSLGVTMTATPAQLEVTGNVDYVRSDKYRLEYSDLSITWINQTFGAGFHPVSSIVKVRAAQDPDSFKEQVLKMMTLVRKIEQGNICFPPKPQVHEVVDYLQALAD